MKNFKKYLLIALLAGISIINEAQTVKPVKNSNGSYGFTFANVYFEVSPKLGGRVSSLKVDTTQILYLATINDANGSDGAGSVFWPSPQSIWNWPPPVELNYNAFTAYPTDSNIMVSSSKNSTLSLSETKVYAVNTADTSIIITYYLRNWKSTAQQWAPWEVTRVNADGLTFFAVGSGNITGTLASNAKIIGNYAWYCEDSTTVSASGVSKFNCDGKGWLAHITKSRYILIKKFPDIKPSQSPTGEAEVECYTSPGPVSIATELEDQGAYTSIANGDSLKWQVKWYVRKLPDVIKGVSGEVKLLNYVYSIMTTDTTSTLVKSNDIVSFNMYPNPVFDKLTIKGQVSYINNATALLYNLQGELILKQSLAISPIIDMKNISTGAYIIQIIDNKNERLLSNIIIKK